MFKSFFNAIASCCGLRKRKDKPQPVTPPSTSLVATEGNVSKADSKTTGEDKSSIKTKQEYLKEIFSALNFYEQEYPLLYQTIDTRLITLTKQIILNTYITQKGDITRFTAEQLQELLEYKKQIYRIKNLNWKEILLKQSDPKFLEAISANLSSCQGFHSFLLKTCTLFKEKIILWELSINENLAVLNKNIFFRIGRALRSGVKTVLQAVLPIDLSIDYSFNRKNFWSLLKTGVGTTVSVALFYSQGVFSAVTYSLLSLFANKARKYMLKEKFNDELASVSSSSTQAYYSALFIFQIVTFIKAGQSYKHTGNPQLLFLAVVGLLISQGVIKAITRIPELGPSSELFSENERTQLLVSFANSGSQLTQLAVGWCTQNTWTRIQEQLIGQKQTVSQFKLLQKHDVIKDLSITTRPSGIQLLLGEPNTFDVTYRTPLTPHRFLPKPNTTETELIASLMQSYRCSVDQNFQCQQLKP